MESLSERRGALAGHGLFLKAPFGASGAAFSSFCLLGAFRVHCWVAAHANLGFPEKLVWKIGARLCVMGDRFFSQSHNLGMRFSRPLGTTRPLVRSRGEPISPSPFLGWTNSGCVRWRVRAALGIVLRLSCLLGGVAHGYTFTCVCICRQVHLCVCMHIHAPSALFICSSRRHCSW